MKKTLYIFLFPLLPTVYCLLPTSCFSQNLVPNPSFEQYTSCPDNFCQIHRATGWSAWGYTPDYFNTCGIFPASVPANNPGTQFPATGNGYAGFFVFDNTGSPCGACREYLGIPLISPLTIGQKYYVQFKVSLSDKVRVGINKMGALFTTILFEMDSATACTQTNTILLPNNFAHVYTDSIITDTANWTLVSGSFIADSAYQYIVIGNHFTDTNTSYIIINTNPPCCFAYYYLDDVYVGTDSTASIFENKYQEIVSVYPNPFSTQTTLQTDIYLHNATLSVYNCFGQEVKQIKNISGQSITFHRGNLPSGLYFVRLTEENTTIAAEKLIVTD